MAFGDSSAPVNFGRGQTAGGTTELDRTLFLDIFGGEVLTAFDFAKISDQMVTVRNLGPGMRSARFPKTWKATAEYHARGQEMLGNDIQTGEITITPDELLVAHTGVYDVDEMLSHFDTRGPFSTEMGIALANVYDKNNFRQAILASREAASGPFPGGTEILDSTLISTGAIDGNDWIDAIEEAQKALYEKDVPETQARHMVVNWDVFQAIKNARDSNGVYKVLDRDISGTQASGGFTNLDQTLMIHGVTVHKSRNLPTTDEAADTSVYEKYRADYSTVTGVLMTPMAVANVKLRDISLETTRDVRRQEDFMVASMMAGHGTLRPECAVSFKTA